MTPDERKYEQYKRNYEEYWRKLRKQHREQGSAPPDEKTLGILARAFLDLYDPGNKSIPRAISQPSPRLTDAEYERRRVDDERDRVRLAQTQREERQRQEQLTMDAHARQILGRLRVAEKLEELRNRYLDRRVRVVVGAFEHLNQGWWRHSIDLQIELPYPEAQYVPQIRRVTGPYETTSVSYGPDGPQYSVNHVSGPHDETFYKITGVDEKKYTRYFSIINRSNGITGKISSKSNGITGINEIGTTYVEPNVDLSALGRAVDQLILDAKTVFDDTDAVERDANLKRARIRSMIGRVVANLDF